MFRSLCQALANQLGPSFIIYYNEDVSDNKKLVSNGKTVGVFRVQSGTIRPLPGNRGLDATVNIDFFANIETAEEVKKIDNAIDMLASNKNGSIGVQTRNELNEGVLEEIIVYRYVINFQPPRVVGNTVIGEDSDRYVIKQLTFTVQLSADLIFGDSGKIYLADVEITENNKGNYLLDGVLSWSPTIQNTMGESAEINKSNADCIPQYAVKKAVITGLVNNTAHFLSIMQGAYNAPQKVYNFLFEMDTGNSNTPLTTAYRAVIERFTPTGIKSNFVTYEMLLSPVPDWLEA